MVAEELSSLRVTRRFAGSAPAMRNFLGVSALYVLAYAAINAVTDSLTYGPTTITLWSPDNALSVILLLHSSLYAPLVLVTSIATDLWFKQPETPAFAVVFSDLIVTFGYLVIAVVLRDAFRFDIRKATYANMIALLAVAPSAAILTGAVYCGALYVTGSLPFGALFKGLEYFWIGDAVGMIVLIPAAVAFYDIFSRARWRALRTTSRAAIATAMPAVVAVLITASIEIPDSRYLFSLLFLPVLWIGVAFGYDAVAITLLATQLLLVAILGASHASIDKLASFQTQMFVLASTGQLLGALVTEREEATRDVARQRADLNRLTAQATTGALAAAFAHEISQPLAALSGYVHAARRLLANPGETEGAAAALQKAEAETRRTRDIVTRIRDFVASGKLDLASCDLGAIARKIVSINREEARARDVRLEFEPAETPVNASVDRIAIEQALNNLVVNAIELATRSDETRGLVRITLAREPATMRIEVEDDGPGVSEEIASHLFEAFETTKPRGMGLGLTLAQQIVAKHGGRLSWRARAPRGAVFVIELPAKDAALET